MKETLFGQELEEPLAVQIACLKREIAMRKNVYPKWTASGRMKEADSVREIAAMTAALHTLVIVQENQPI